MSAKSKKAAPPLASVADVLDGLKTIAQCVRDIEKERTEQTKLKEDARVRVEEIHAMRDVLTDYLKRSFDEREENFEKLFARLDTAIEKNDVQLAAVVLDSVVKLAESSPFKALSDVAATRAALNQKGKEWKF